MRKHVFGRGTNMTLSNVISLELPKLREALNKGGIELFRNMLEKSNTQNKS